MPGENTVMENGLTGLFSSVLETASRPLELPRVVSMNAPYPLRPEVTSLDLYLIAQKWDPTLYKYHNIQRFVGGVSILIDMTEHVIINLINFFSFIQTHNLLENKHHIGPWSGPFQTHHDT